MSNTDVKRIARLTAILTHLQSKKIVTSTELAKKFGVSVRTIYRDIKTLEQAGIPIVTEDGKGYSLLEGYRIPPVMFTENEAHALITTEQLVLKNKDLSLVREYTEAINKIKAVLKTGLRNNTELLSKRIVVKPQFKNENPSSFLIEVQKALTTFEVLEINYHTESRNETTWRKIEPFAVYINPEDNWMLIAFCRLRKEFRLFRMDRILAMNSTGEQFEQHKITLEEYLENARRKFFGTPDIQLS